MARGEWIKTDAAEPRQHETGAKNDTEEVRALGETLGGVEENGVKKVDPAKFSAAVQANKSVAPESKEQLARAKAKSKFVTNEIRLLQGEKMRIKDAPFIHDVVMPVDEESAKEAYDAEANLRKMEAAERAAAVAALERNAEEYQYFLRCRNCYGHGIYFTGPVADGQVIGDKDWFSRYKGKGTIWRQKILCQNCLRNGVERDLSVELIDWTKGLFRADSRWVRAVPKDPTLAAKEGSVRVHELALVSQNIIGTLAD